MQAQGNLHKMLTEAASPVGYRLQLGGQQLSLNDWLGKDISIEYLQQIECIHCGRITRKSFSQGYCYPCFSSLAQCDLCIKDTYSGPSAIFPGATESQKPFVNLFHIAWSTHY